MSDGSVVLVLLRLLVSLGVVIALLVVLARWARRRGLGGAVGSRTGVEIEPLSRRALGRGSAVHVVRIGDEVLVLGVTDQQVSMLHRLPAEAAAALDAVGDGPVAERGQAPDFDAVLAARTADPQETYALASRVAASTGAPATRAERRALAGARGRAATSPAPGSSSVPTGWPWSAATLVLGALKGGRA